jgi:hypothetical protein
MPTFSGLVGQFDTDHTAVWIGLQESKRKYLITKQACHPRTSTYHPC